MSYMDGGGDGASDSKIRKPYTITKQREIWTEEEHTKFLEALSMCAAHASRTHVCPAVAW